MTNPLEDYAEDERLEQERLAENALINFRIAILSVLQLEKYEKKFIDHMCENTYVKKTRNVNGELYTTIEFPDEIEQFKDKIFLKYHEQNLCDKCKKIYAVLQ